MSFEQETLNPLDEPEEQSNASFRGQFGPSFRRVVVNALENQTNRQEMAELFRREHFLRYAVIFELADEKQMPSYARLADPTKKVYGPENQYQVFDAFRRYGKAILRDAEVDMVSFGSYSYELYSKVTDGLKRDELQGTYAAYLYWVMAQNIDVTNKIHMEGIVREKVAVNFPDTYRIIQSVPWDQWGGLLGASVRGTVRRYGIQQLDSYTDFVANEDFVISNYDDALTAYQKMVTSKSVMPFEQVICKLQDMEFAYANGEDTSEIVKSIVEGNLRLGHYFTTMYYHSQNRDVLLDRIMAGAVPGLTRAVELLDWRLNVALTTYAGHRIRSNVQKVVQREQWPWMKAWEIETYQKFMRLLGIKEQEVQRKLGEADFEQVWESGGFEPRHKEHFFTYLLPSAFAGRPLSLDTPQNEDDERSLIDILAPHTEAPVLDTVEQTRERAITLLRLRGGMSLMQEYILERRLFYPDNRQPPLRQVAEDFAAEHDRQVVTRELIRQQEVIGLQLFERNVSWRLQVDLRSKSAADLHRKLKGTREGDLPERIGPMSEKVEETLQEARELIFAKDFNSLDDLLLEDSDVLDYGLRLGIGNIDQFVYSYRIFLNQNGQKFFDRDHGVNSMSTVPYRATLLIGVLRHYGMSWSNILPYVEEYSQGISKEFDWGQARGPSRLPEVLEQIAPYAVFGPVLENISELPARGGDRRSNLRNDRAVNAAQLYDELYYMKTGDTTNFYTEMRGLLAQAQKYITIANEQWNGAEQSRKVAGLRKYEPFNTVVADLSDLIRNNSYIFKTTFHPLFSTFEEFDAKARMRLDMSDYEAAVQEYFGYVTAVMIHRFTSSGETTADMIPYMYPDVTSSPSNWIPRKSLYDMPAYPMTLSRVEHSRNNLVTETATSGEISLDEFMNSEDFGVFVGALFAYAGNRSQGLAGQVIMSQGADRRYQISYNAAEALDNLKSRTPPLQSRLFSYERGTSADRPLTIAIENLTLSKFLLECKNDPDKMIDQLSKNFKTAAAFMKFYLSTVPEENGYRSFRSTQDAAGNLYHRFIVDYMLDADLVVGKRITDKSADVLLKDRTNLYEVQLSPHGYAKFVEWLDSQSE
jgi:DNA-directed RNA polymerase sigma subunit (sigma70/sigma32)